MAKANFGGRGPSQKQFIKANEELIQIELKIVADKEQKTQFLDIQQHWNAIPPPPPFAAAEEFPILLFRVVVVVEWEGKNC